jgi:hypothetical protein
MSLTMMDGLSRIGQPRAIWVGALYLSRVFDVIGNGGECEAR